MMPVVRSDSISSVLNHCRDVEKTESPNMLITSNVSLIIVPVLIRKPIFCI